MSAIDFDTETPVTTLNNSCIDLKAQADSSLQEGKSKAGDCKFLQHPVYTHYLTAYSDHLNKHKDNPLVTDIDENIWPMLTGQTLSGKGKISFRSHSNYIIDPVFLDPSNPAPEDIYGSETVANSSFTFFHLGEELTGHKSIIHGGLLATILDELACRLAFQNFPSRKGVTANLNINYRKPCFVDSFILLRCDVSKKQGRKCWVNAKIYFVDLNDKDPSNVETVENLLSECECFVIEPKWVNNLNNK